MNASNKASIRAEHIKRRSNISEIKRKEASKAIYSRIITLPVYQYAQKIALYQAVNGEIDLKSIWSHAEDAKKTCYMPRVIPNTKDLLFLPSTQNTPQKPNQWGILEPCVSDDLAACPETIDLMLIPLVAFDKKGNRLGMGAGFYDRALANSKPKCLLGVAYDWQERPNILLDVWDIPLTGIITDKDIYWSNP